MIKRKIVTDLEVCEALWKAFIKIRYVTDIWDFRLCFQRHFMNRPYFMVFEDRQGVYGILPLAHISEEDLFVFFPGEIWNGKTWLERTPVYCREPHSLHTLLSECPERTYLRYMEVENGSTSSELKVDEIGYLLHPPDLAFDIDGYYKRFPWKKLKAIKKEIASILGTEGSWHINRIPDYDLLVKMNLDSFGENSYFYDSRFTESFRDILWLLKRKGWLRLVSLEVAGLTVAVDLAALYDGSYVPFLGGTHPDFRGVAKVMNMHHLQFAMRQGLSRVDFLCGDFHWKKLWHLDPDPLYKFVSPALREESRTPEETHEDIDFIVPLTEGQKKGLRDSFEAVLVFGTTPDYVAKIYGTHSGSVVFFVDDRFAGDPYLKVIPSSALLFGPLENLEETYHRATMFLSSNDISPTGIACFDCESLMAASVLASRLQKIFPPWQTIVRSRNKFEARKIWASAGIASPAAVLSSDLIHTLNFFQRHAEGIVLKPLSGSGSELLFHCKSEEEVRRAVGILKQELPARKSNPLFKPLLNPLGEGPTVDPCRYWIAEEFIAGEEFSCDFVYQDKKISLIRETGKVKAADQPFGSVLAYTFPPLYPRGFKKRLLLATLQKAVTALGFDWGYFMADYIIRDGLPLIIEVTSRPGGDAIPDLVRIAANRDTLAIYLDFVSGKFQGLDEISMPPQSFASINFYAPKEGTILRLDGSKIAAVPEVKALFFKKREGDSVILPPKDYDNRLIGYCILELKSPADLPTECRRMQYLLDLAIRDETAHPSKLHAHPDSAHESP